MKNLTPVAREDRDPLPAFEAVPRKHRHDGWTPERQRAFIEALADTGCVSRAAARVNMSPEGAYYLRRQPNAESFRRAWEAALDFGIQRLKDIAFERAIDGQLVPIFVAGKLLGFRRKKNDRLLMFCLRMNMKDQDGRRLSASYFDRDDGTTTTVTNLTRAEKDDDNAALIQAFDPVTMTLPEIAAMQAMLAQAAARHATTAAVDDPDATFLSIGPNSNPYIGDLEDEIGPDDPDFVPYDENEPDWRTLGLDDSVDQVARQAEIDSAVASVRAAKPSAIFPDMPPSRT